MTNFVTYAQNFEDLMLWRALSFVDEGFYIDVGAADPDEDSVTRAFYDRGWQGINIEPAPSYFDALRSARPRDVTLQCLIGDIQGEAELHHFQSTGLSTTNITFATRHTTDGRPSTSLKLSVFPLSEIWRRYAPSNVHFLKIDVEGSEADVLRGAELNTYRPWIILAEATEPGSCMENWFDWEEILTNASYRFVWFDGLNRFYIAAEHWERLHGAFSTPPNVFDQWIQPRGKQQRALIDHGAAATLAAMGAANNAHEALEATQARIEALQMELSGVKQILNSTRQELLVARQTRDQFESAYRVIHNSTFWRATAPMRRAVTVVRNLSQRSNGDRVVPKVVTGPAATEPGASKTIDTEGDSRLSSEEERHMLKRLSAWTDV